VLKSWREITAPVAGSINQKNTAFLLDESPASLNEREVSMNRHSRENPEASTGRFILSVPSVLFLLSANAIGHDATSFVQQLHKITNLGHES
jgi:hypothetical protein